MSKRLATVSSEESRHVLKIILKDSCYGTRIHISSQSILASKAQHIRYGIYTNTAPDIKKKRRKESQVNQKNDSSRSSSSSNQ